MLAPGETRFSVGGTSASKPIRTKEYRQADFRLFSENRKVFVSFVRMGFLFLIVLFWLFSGKKHPIVVNE